MIARPTEKEAKLILRERIVERKRVRCSVCKVLFDWHELEPGTGRCPDCMP